jgi:hypothetical protein
MPTRFAVVSLGLCIAWWFSRHEPLWMKLHPLTVGCIGFGLLLLWNALERRRSRKKGTCLCGISDCEGHEVIDGFAIFTRSHRALEES